jgi:hypothetical protein
MDNTSERSREKAKSEVSERCKLLVDTFMRSMGSINAQIIYIEWLKRNKNVDCDEVIKELKAKGSEQFFSPEEKKYIVDQYLHAPTTSHTYPKNDSSNIIQAFVGYLEQTLNTDRNALLSYQTRQYDFDLSQLNGISEEQVTDILKKTAIAEHQEFKKMME